MAKLTRPIIRIHNIETDEVIDREMNDAEFAQYQIDQANHENSSLRIQSHGAKGFTCCYSTLIMHIFD